MCVYTVTRSLNSEEFSFNTDTPTLDIGDPRFLYRCIRNPLKSGTIDDIIKGYPSKKEYLHKKLDKRNLLDITFFEKHKNYVVLKTENGEKLTVKDFWQPCINDVSISFLNQLTLQISKFLFQKIPSCIKEDTSISFYNQFCIKDKGCSYSAISIQPLETPDNFLEIISVIVIKWRSKSSEFEYIETSQEVDENLIEFMLCDYAEEEAFCKYYFKYDTGIQGCLDRLADCVSANKNNFQTASIKTDNYIDVYDLEAIEDLDCYPDIVFKLNFDKIINENILKQTENVLSEFINKYNSKNKNKIHDAFCIDDLDSNYEESNNCLLFAVDFGNCNPEVIFKLVAFLENSNLKIHKIQIKV